MHTGNSQHSGEVGPAVLPLFQNQEQRDKEKSSVVMGRDLALPFSLC